MPKTPAVRTASREAAAHTRAYQRRRRRKGSKKSPEGSDVLLQDAAKAWIRDHSDAALLAAFAAGLFIGAWMIRDKAG